MQTLTLVSQLHTQQIRAKGVRFMLRYKRVMHIANSL